MIKLKSEQDTKLFAKRLVDVLPKGSLLILRGPLGAGKTTLVRYIAAAMGFSGRVSSPTYTLMHTYPTPLGDLLHADVYRLPKASEIYSLGFEDARENAYLTVVEWGTINDFPGAIEIILEPDADETRVVSITPHFPHSRDFIEKIINQ